MASSPAPSLSELDSDLAALRVVRVYLHPRLALSLSAALHAYTAGAQQLHDNICRSFLDVAVHLEEHVNDEELPYIADDCELLLVRPCLWAFQLSASHEANAVR